MQQDFIRYRGSYKYADRGTLERAMARAHAELDDGALDDDCVHLHFFVARDTTLTVSATVPAGIDHRLAAANVFLILAQDALDGTFAADAYHANHGFTARSL
jgi:hypothetical protein